MGYFWPVTVNVLAMVAVTAGTFYQKRFVHGGDLRSVVAVQYLGALPPVLLIAWLTEPMHFAVNFDSIATLIWSVVGLSIGAIVLMLEMIRRGEVSRVASLIYLVPPTVAVQAWLLFGETLLAVQVVGMAVTALGVYLTTKRR
jgi:drug/metabolite transporter (DMT)-like permease